MKPRKRHPIVADQHNGLVNVETTGPLGWLLAQTSGLPRSGMISSRLELREGPAGERWTRHLRPGRSNPAVCWVQNNASHELVEQLGPVRMRFTTSVNNGVTTVRLRYVCIGRFRVSRRLVNVEALGETVDNGQLRTSVEMTLLGGKVGSLTYTSILLTE